MGIGTVRGLGGVLNAALNDTRDEGFTFLLMGDLRTMSEMEAFFRKNGFEVGHQNVYPALREQDIERALRLLWERKYVRWCPQFRSKLIELGICTDEQFVAAWNELYGS